MIAPLNKILDWIKFALLCLLSAILVYPVLIVIFVPALIYRYFVKILVKITSPKCGEMITGIGGSLAGNNNYSVAPMVLSPYMLFSEKVDIKKVKEIFYKNIIKPNLYPKLKQKLVSKFGYIFWQTISNFDLDNHVKYLSPECPEKPVLLSDLRGAEGDSMVYRTFDKRYSPWELIVIPNLFDPDNSAIKSAIVFSYNHCLMDALSGMKLCEKTATKAWDWPIAKIMAKKSKKTTWKNKMSRIHAALKLILTGPYHAINLAHFQNENGDFIKEVTTVSKGQDYSNIWSPRNKIDVRRFDVARMNKIKDSLQVGMSSVVTTIVILGVSRYLKSRHGLGFSNLPKTFFAQFVVPLPDHPETKLVNHWSVARLSSCIEDSLNPVGTVKRINRHFQELASSVVPVVTYLMMASVSILPVSMRPDVRKSAVRQTILFTNFPGPKSAIDMFGYKMEDWGALGSAPVGSAVVVGAQSLAEKFWIDAGGVRSLFPQQEDLMTLQNCFHTVFKELEN